MQLCYIEHIHSSSLSLETKSTKLKMQQLKKKSVRTKKTKEKLKQVRVASRILSKNSEEKLS